MGKNTQEAEVIVTLNGEAAKRAIADLTKEYEGLKNKAMEAYKAGNDALGKKLDAQAKKLMKDIEITQKETKKFADILKNINSASLKDLNAVAKQLRNEINKLKPGTQEFIDKSKQLQQVNTRVKQLQMSFKGVVEEEKAATFSMKGLADGFNKYFGMITAGIATMTGMSMAFRKAAEDAAALDDVYSDVMKTTGLTHDQVENLDKELMKIDTRTSREQLLLLARDAGKLGISGEEELLGFVRAADQIQVALGEDLGEGAIRNLGKIADVLGYTKSMGIEAALMSIGSAVNAVGQDSTASEAYLVEFTQRLAGVGAQAGISAADIIGFASGLDQSAMKVEMAATAFQKFLMKMYEDPAQFAAYAKMEVQDFTDLLNNDANTAITTVLKSLKDQDGFGSLVPIFKDMGLDGARAVSVLASMASNLGAITDAQALANEEFAKATSLTEEYNTKNNNLQAQLEKARKEFHNASVTLGQSLNPILLKSTKITTYLIKALAEYGKEIKTVLIVMGALLVVLKAKVIWLKLVATWNATLKAGSLALAAAQALLTGNIAAATAAWKAMSLVMKATVFGAIVAAVSALVIALQRLNEKTKEQTRLQKYEKQIQEDIAKATSDEANRVKSLKAIVEDTNQSYYDRKAAIDELRKIVPEYHGDLTKEGELIGHNAEVLDDYIKKMLIAAKTQALQDKLRENAGKQMEQEDIINQIVPDEFKDKATGEIKSSYEEPLIDELGNVVKDRNGNIVMIRKMFTDTTGELRSAMKELDDLKEEEELLLSKIKDIADLKISLNPSTVVTNPKGKGGESDDLEKQYEEEQKLLQQHLEKEKNLLRQRYLDGVIDRDEYNARLKQKELEHLKAMLELTRKYGFDDTKALASVLEAQIRMMEEATKEAAAKAAETDSTDFDVESRLEAQKKMEEMLADAKKLIAEESWAEEYEFEVWKLDQLKEAKLLSEKDYQKARLKLAMQAGQKYTQQAINFANQVSDAVNAFKDMELAKAEATYQAELTAAGDNAAAREEAEQNYNQKKLEITKKYANVEMTINIAKAIASGALAIMQAFAQLGPIGGAIAAVLVAATTAAEVATIVQQRNAIMAQTLESSGGSAQPVGQRTLTGYSEGGYTDKASNDHKPAGVVHANEWVAPAWMVRREPVVFANLEQYRRSGGRGTGNARRGFAEGGFAESDNTLQQTTGGKQLLTEETGQKILAAVQRDTRAWVSLNDIEARQKQKNKFKAATGKY